MMDRLSDQSTLNFLEYARPGKRAGNGCNSRGFGGSSGLCGERGKRGAAAVAPSAQLARVPGSFSARLPFVSRWSKHVPPPRGGVDSGQRRVCSGVFGGMWWWFRWESDRFGNGRDDDHVPSKVGG